MRNCTHPSEFQLAREGRHAPSGCTALSSRCEAGVCSQAPRLPARLLRLPRLLALPVPLRTRGVCLAPHRHHDSPVPSPRCPLSELDDASPPARRCPAGSSSRQTSRPTTPSGATSTSRPSASCSTTWASPGRRTASGSRPAGRPCAGRGYRRSCAQSARGDSQTLLLRRKYLLDVCVASIHTCSCKSVTMWVKP